MRSSGRRLNDVLMIIRSARATTTNLGGDSQMDVVELVPSVSFSPRTNYMDECLTGHIQIIACFDFFKRTSVVAKKATSELNTLSWLGGCMFVVIN